MADYDRTFYRGVGNWGRMRGTSRPGYGRDYWLGRGWRTGPRRDIRSHIYPYRDYDREYGFGRHTAGPRPGAEREVYRPRSFGYGEREYRPGGERGWGERLRHGWRELRGETREMLGMGYGREYPTRRGRRYGTEYEPHRRDRWGW